MLGTATKSEQDTLIEQMNAEIARLREAYSDACDQITLMREELSRAAVRDREARGVVEFARRCFDTPISRRRIDNEYATEARKAMADFLATPSPLSDAAQEVLEAYPPALGLLLNFKYFCENETGHHCNDPDAECPIAMGEWWEREEIETFERAMAAHKKFRALLEGRDRKEG